MRIGFLADPHFDSQSVSNIEKLSDLKLEKLFILGDIGTALTFQHNLEWLQNLLKIPIYFVLGNHDFYHGYIDDVIYQSHNIPNTNITALPGEYIRIGKTVIFGTQSWYDGTGANFNELNDFRYIKDFAGKPVFVIQQVVEFWSNNNAEIIGSILNHLKNTKDNNIILLTHVPPFEVDLSIVTQYITKPKNELTPYFVNRKAGQVIREFARQNPDINIRVIAGHRHQASKQTILPNLTQQVLMGHYTELYPFVEEI